MTRAKNTTSGFDYEIIHKRNVLLTTTADNQLIYGDRYDIVRKDQYRVVASFHNHPDAYEVVHALIGTEIKFKS